MKRLMLIAALCLLATIVNAATFKGYKCTGDCAGHKAGYEWAMRKGITDKSNCTGKNRSFVEGCYAWVDELTRRLEEQ